MELIDQLEPTKRGLYGGACGYLSYAGDMDVAIAIRTGIIKDGTLYVQAAAGVVADSVPELEWKETEHKARALLRAAELVEEGLRMTRAIDKLKHCTTMQDVRRQVNALDDVLVPLLVSAGLHDPGRPHQARPRPGA